MNSQRAFRSLIAAAGLAVGLIGGTSGILAQAPTSEPCPGAPVTQLRSGFRAIVTPGAANNVRSYYGLKEALVGQLQPGQMLDLYSGPFCADGYIWWQIASGDLFGYTVEGKGSDYFIVPYEPTPIATEEAGTVSVDSHDVQFSFDSRIAPAVSAADLPEYPATADGPGWGIAPAGVQFTFFDGTESSSYPSSTLTVYPAAGFSKLDPNTGSALAELKALIASQSASSKDPLPEVPIINAAQVIRASIKSLTLGDGGQGVRFLTWYAQDLSVASNENLRYEFRGFSRDGRVYVSAQFAVRTPALPDTVDYQQIADQYAQPSEYEKYLTEITDRLTSLPADQFTPGLDQLDALMQSLRFARG